MRRTRVPMRRAAVWTLRIGGGAIVLAILVVAGVYVWLRFSTPQENGSIELSGLGGPVKVMRDADGVPHISADSVDDAFFALGFVQAQDRLFEMDLLRRYGEGRISEIGGERTVQLDRFMRTIGLDRAAKQQMTELSPATLRVLAAFAAGVNAYIHNHSAGEQPYYLFVPAPRRWRVVDTLVIGQVFSFYLAQNYRREIEHARLAKRVSPEQLQDLYPEYPESGLITLASLGPLYDRLPLQELARLLPPFSAHANASNNWVLDGAHSETGKPILENDPHLTYTTPSVWYLAQLATKTLNLTGGFIPGVPFMVVGHNNRSGWGFTETGGDVEDLFVEMLNPANPDEYMTPQGCGALPHPPRDDPCEGRRRRPDRHPLHPARPGRSPMCRWRSKSMLSSISTGAKSITPPGYRPGAAGDLPRAWRQDAAGALGDGPGGKLGGFQERAARLRRAADEHGLCRRRRRDRLHGAWPHPDPQDGRRMAACARLDGRVRLEGHDPVR